MKISDYVSFFHDGSIIAIQHNEDEILISMESAEIFHTDVENTIILSEQNTLKGILHIENPISIFMDKEPFANKIKMLADIAGILNFEMKANKVRLFIEWINYPPKPHIEKYADVEIEAGKIFWENDPRICRSDS